MKKGSAHFPSLIDTQTYVYLHNSPAKFENGLDKERGKTEFISDHTLIHKLAHFRNSPSKVIGQERKRGSAHFQSYTNTQTQCSTTHLLMVIWRIGKITTVDIIHSTRSLLHNSPSDVINEHINYHLTRKSPFTLARNTPFFFAPSGQ